MKHLVNVFDRIPREDDSPRIAGPTCRMTKWRSLQLANSLKFDPVIPWRGSCRAIWLDASNWSWSRIREVYGVPDCALCRHARHYTKGAVKLQKGASTSVSRWTCQFLLLLLRQWWKAVVVHLGWFQLDIACCGFYSSSPGHCKKTEMQLSMNGGTY